MKGYTDNGEKEVYFRIACFVHDFVYINIIHRHGRTNWTVPCLTRTRRSWQSQRQTSTWLSKIQFTLNCIFLPKFETLLSIIILLCLNPKSNIPIPSLFISRYYPEKTNRNHTAVESEIILRLFFQAWQRSLVDIDHRASSDVKTSHMPHLSRQ